MCFVHPDVLRGRAHEADRCVDMSQSFSATPTKLLTADGEAPQHTVDLFPIEVDGSTLAAVEFDISCWQQPAPKAPAAPQIGAMAGSLGRALLEASSTPTLIQDVDTILFANRTARDRLGVGDG